MVLELEMECNSRALLELWLKHRIWHLQNGWLALFVPASLGALPAGI